MRPEAKEMNETFNECYIQSEKPVETKYIENQCNCRNKKIYWYCDKKQIARKLKNNSLYNCRAQLRICS